MWINKDINTDVNVDVHTGRYQCCNECGYTKISSAEVCLDIQTLNDMYSL